MRANTIAAPNVYGGMGDDGDVGTAGTLNVFGVSDSPTSTSFDNWWNTVFDTPDVPGTTGGIPYSGTPTNTTNGTTNANSIANVTGIVGSLTNSFTSIFKAIQPIPAGCTSVAGPYGTSLQCGTFNGTTSNLSLGVASSLGTGTILLLGAAVVGIMLLKK